jgi:AP-2 complex subunit alpha
MANRANICKKASLCLLRLFRTNPECIDVEEWLPRLGKLLEDRDIGVILSVMSLALGMAAHQPEATQPLVPYVISILTRLVVNRTASYSYMYYQTPSPWLQVKCLRFLRYYECPAGHQRVLLGEVLQHVLTMTENSDSVNKNNIDHAILVEAVSLVASYGTDCDSHLRLSALTLLGRFISQREANIRYLGLDIMNALVKREGPDAVKSHKTTIVEALREADVSVRKRALELLFSLSDAENAHEIVSELVTNLATADSIMKEDMVVKIAILTEKYANGNYDWYLDTMLKVGMHFSVCNQTLLTIYLVQVIFIAGDFVAEAVWHRIVLIVTNHPDTHEHAAQKLLESVQSKYCHDTALVLASYLLGEIGVNICDRPGMSGYDQFAALHQHFLLASSRSQAILLTTYMKLYNLYPDVRELISDIFTKYSTSSQLEIQQRSCEYLKMPTVGQEIMEQVLLWEIQSHWQSNFSACCPGFQYNAGVFCCQRKCLGCS